MLYLLLFAYLLMCIVLSQIVFRSLTKHYPEHNTWSAALYVMFVSLRWPWTLLKQFMGTERVVYIIAKENKDAIHKDRKEKEKPNQEGLGSVSSKEEKEKKEEKVNG